MAKVYFFLGHEGNNYLESRLIGHFQGGDLQRAPCQRLNRDSCSGKFITEIGPISAEEEEKDRKPIPWAQYVGRKSVWPNDSRI